MPPTTTNLSETPTDEKNFWRTPPQIFSFLESRYGPYDVDGAADENNHLLPLWMGPGSPLGIGDALSAPWVFPDLRTARVWINPPYGRGVVERFMIKAVNEYHINGTETTLLVPVATDQQWWHDFVWDQRRDALRRDVAVYFFRQRIRFLRPHGQPAGSPTFASMAVHFGLR